MGLMRDYDITEEKAKDISAQLEVLRAQKK